MAPVGVIQSGIHNFVIMLLAEQIGKLQYRYRKKNDAALKARLTGSRLRHWKFVESLFALRRVQADFCGFLPILLSHEKIRGVDILWLRYAPSVPKIWWRYRRVDIRRWLWRIRAQASLREA